MAEQQLINPGGYVPVSVVDAEIDSNNNLVLKFSNNKDITLALPAGGSGSDTDIVEVKDTVTSIQNGAADTHKITATEGNGTQNEVGSFCIAAKQPINYDFYKNAQTGFGISLHTVNQNASVEQTGIPLFGSVNGDIAIDSETFEIPSSFNGILVFAKPDEEHRADIFIPLNHAIIDKIGQVVTDTAGNSVTVSSPVHSECAAIAEALYVGDDVGANMLISIWISIGITSNSINIHWASDTALTSVTYAFI